MNKATKFAILALITLSASACDTWSSLDRRDIVYNDSMCQPNNDGACW